MQVLILPVIISHVSQQFHYLNGYICNYAVDLGLYRSLFTTEEHYERMENLVEIPQILKRIKPLKFFMFLYCLILLQGLS